MSEKEKEIYIFEISKSSFHTSVILNSYKLPVLVEFMGVWSGPCVQMADRLAMLAREFAGQFIFAKIDVDEQPELRQEYGIENVPTLKVFRDGEVIRSEEGQLEEAELRALLEGLGVFRESDKLREQAREKHLAGETIEAISLLTKAIKQDPGNTRVALDMAQVLIDIGELEQARALFNKLPERDRESEQGRTLIGQFTFKDLAAKTQGEQRLKARLEENPADHDARFDLAVCMVAEHRYEQAVELLGQIVEQEPEFKEGAAREMMINLSNMLAPNEPQLAQSIRRQLGNLLSQ